MIVGREYTEETRRAMSMLSEKDMSFDMIDSLLKYIKGLGISGAVLIFLPGWNLIFALQKHLREHPLFGSPEYRILPLHSQIPRGEQRMVFDPVPEGVTKVQSTNFMNLKTVL